MPFNDRDPDEEEDTFFDDVTRMADRMGLEGQKRANYIDDHMTQAGYERIQARESYVRPKRDDDGGGGDGGGGASRWFGRSDDRPRPRGGGGGGGRPGGGQDDDRF